MSLLCVRYSFLFFSFLPDTVIYYLCFDIVFCRRAGHNYCITGVKRQRARNTVYYGMLLWNSLILPDYLRSSHNIPHFFHYTKFCFRYIGFCHTLVLRVFFHYNDSLEQFIYATSFGYVSFIITISCSYVFCVMADHIWL